MVKTMQNNEAFNLAGRTFLIAGGTRGIGRAISLRFAQAGANVVAIYVRGKEAAESLKSLAREQEITVDCLCADLTRANGLEKISVYLNDNNIRLSGLVYCAATGVHKHASEFTAREIKWVFSLNIEAYIELVNLLLPYLNEDSSIIAISSKGATRAVYEYGLVGASKGALEAYSRHLAAELSERKIRVNVLTPGTVRTDAWDVLPDSERRLADAEARTPLGRLVTVDEVAYSAQFLCSDAASGIVGHSLVVDGGTEIVE
jgi:enoyl-[acyl-carrier protein] reductase III